MFNPLWGNPPTKSFRLGHPLFEIRNILLPLLLLLQVQQLINRVVNAGVDLRSLSHRLGTFLTERLGFGFGVLRRKGQIAQCFMGVKRCREAVVQGFIVVLDNLANFGLLLFTKVESQ